MTLQDAQSLHQSGDFKAAIAAYQSLLKTNPKDATALHFLGMAQLQSGDKNGESTLKQAIALAPDNELFQTNYANLLAQLGNIQGAYSIFEETTKISPHNLLAQEGAGQCAMKLGKLTQALAHFKTAIAHDKNRIKSLELAGVTAFKLGRYAETKAYFTKILMQAPKHIGAHLHLGLIALSEENFPTAFEHLSTAENLQPNNPAVQMELGRAYLAATAFDAARRHFEKVLTLRPGATEAEMYLAKAHFGLNQFKDAETYADKVLNAEENNAEMLTLKANMASATGDTEKAFSYAKKVALSHPSFAWGFLSATHINAKAIDAEMFSAMEAGLKSAKDPVEKSKWHYALARTLDARKDTQAAWQHYAQGADIIHTSIQEKSGEDKALMNMLMDTFKNAPTALTPKATLPWTPLFIVSMPRSGSTLIEQILSTDESVHAGGELSLLRNCITQTLGGHITRDVLPKLMEKETLSHIREAYIHAAETLFPDLKSGYLTDKMPFNALWVPVIQAALPEAQIVYIKRDPVATCLSCFKQMFNAGQWFTYNLTTLADAYSAFYHMMGQYQALNTHNFTTLSYEDLVNTPEETLKPLLDELKLPWGMHFLEFHNHKRTVRTASVQQVNKPLYTESIQGWKALESELTPLIKRLKEQNIPL